MVVVVLARMQRKVHGRRGQQSSECIASDDKDESKCAISALGKGVTRIYTRIYLPLGAVRRSYPIYSQYAVRCPKEASDLHS